MNKGGYEQSSNTGYDHTHAMDVSCLSHVLQSTQPEKFARMKGDSACGRQKFLDRLQNKIAKRGIVDVLHKGIHTYSTRFDLFYQVPSENGCQIW